MEGTNGLPSLMVGASLPGGRRINWIERKLDPPGYKQVWIKVKASSICGSDIRAIYREHLGVGPEAPTDRNGDNVIGGHEPCGEVVVAGDGCVIRPGARVVVYHIAGCGVCQHCRRGYMVMCTGDARAAHGWQRDGGHAPFMLTEEACCVELPQPLTYLDGALAACGVGTAWEALKRANVSGRDRVLVTGLGPVGMAVCLLATQLGCVVVGMDVSSKRCMRAKRMNLVRQSIWCRAGEEDVVIGDDGSEDAQAQKQTEFEVAVDCSGSPQARLTALTATVCWGRVVLVGEGNSISFPVSPLLIHQQKTLMGSWVTSLPNLAELLDNLAKWNLHPEVLVTDVFPLSDVDSAYQLADRGECGKVAILYDQELERIKQTLSTSS